MAFWIKTRRGLVVCIGCCHAGIINTLQYIVGLTGEKRIHTIVGGLHLLNAQEEQLHKVVSELKQFDIETIIPCHCTGDQAYTHLATACNCIKGYAGMEINA
jgi:7,8-dihydropterin-6-yl-methyl-4-(beta-D-ribofuranosyl)aminobenzene 5'-phosphate synthase